MHPLRLVYNLCDIACLAATGLAWVLMVVANVRSFQGVPPHERRVSILSRSWVTSKIAGRIQITRDEAVYWRRVGRWAMLAFFSFMAATWGFALLASL